MCQGAVNFVVNQNTFTDRIVVNISSKAGVEVKPYTPIYRTTKHAVIAYTRTMAVSRIKCNTKCAISTNCCYSFQACDYFEKYRLKFVTICPGRTLTPMLDCLKADLRENGKSDALNLPFQR